MGFLGSEVLEEKTSKINGKVRVVKTLGLGVYIQAENLTQSGGVVYDVWKKTLKKLKGKKREIDNCLILGFGGGSAGTLVNKYWPGAVITGIDIDPLMVELGRKYLGVPKAEIVISDAKDYLTKTKKKFDLVLIDTYTGDVYPEEFEKEDFLKLVRTRLNKGGIAVFNRLYYGEKRKLAGKFGIILERTFDSVERIFPEANIMFVVS